MVNVLASSVVNNGFGSWSGQTGDYKIGICAPLRRMSKEWYVRNHDNMSKWSDMSLRRLLFRWVSTIQIQLSVDLVQADITNIIISLKCNLFSAWKSDHFALNNNFSYWREQQLHDCKKCNIDSVYGNSYWCIPRNIVVLKDIKLFYLYLPVIVVLLTFMFVTGHDHSGSSFRVNNGII